MIPARCVSVTRLWVAALIGAAAFLLVHRSAQADLVTVSATAPIIDGDDIANDNGAADAGGDQGHIWSNRPLQGQTFTTGPNVNGYTLHAVTLKNLNNTITQAPTFTVRVGTVSGTVFSSLGGGSGVAPNYAPLDYITMTLDTPVSLDPSTVYGFDWDTSAQGFVTVNNLDDSTYGGGTAFSSGAGGVPDDSNIISRNVDRVFHLDISSIPEPSSAVLGLIGMALLLRRRRM